MKNVSKGVIYITTGSKYIKEALVSAYSLKRKNPNIEITLFSDRKVKSKYIDKVIKIKCPKYGFIDKIKYMLKTPYKHTLFLDADTYICDNILELFDLLAKFDIAAAHVPHKSLTKYDRHVPKSLTPFNTGVILYKKSEKINKFFVDWKNRYIKLKENSLKLDPSAQGPTDQPAFLEALFKSTIRIATLSEIYNFRARCGFLRGRVKIIHQHSTLSKFKKTEKSLNGVDTKRGYIFTHNYAKIAKYMGKKGKFKKFKN